MAKTPKLTKLIDSWTERDLSEAARRGELAEAYERGEELDRLEQVLAAGRSPVITGDVGVGKTALVHELLRRVARGNGPEWLHGKRVLQFSIRRRATGLKSRHLIGPCMFKLVEALAKIGDEIVPYFRDFDLAWSFDLEPHFETLGFRLPHPVICEGDHATIESMFEITPELEQHYVILRLKEPGLDRARRTLVSWSEKGQDAAGVRFHPDALEAALQLSHRFLARSHLPRKAIEPLRQLARLHRGDKEITEARVIQRFCESYTLPRFLVDPAVPLDLDEVDKHFRSRLLGQDEAVAAVVDIVSLIKSGLCDPRRPFGVFLFVGPTGVGKTHLAQLIAEYLFGTPDRMVRFNMADFPDDKSASTLFGDPEVPRAQAQRGLLTQRVMGHPFAVLLLDEFEKASPKIHDRFLQLFDEGSFTNGAGEVVSCRSFIIIATSNAGAELWRGGLVGFTGDRDAENIQREVDRRLHEIFRFEFLNRFDHIVHFRPLDREAIRTIALRELEALGNRAGLKQRRFELELDDTLLDWLVVHGYDPYYGARFLRRSIERNVSTTLAELLVRARPEPGARLGLGVRQNRVHARLVEPPPPVQEGEASAERSETAERLDHDRILREVDTVCRKAESRLAALRSKHTEYGLLLEQLDDASFWDDRTGNQKILDRARELDVTIRFEGRLADPIERLIAMRWTTQEPAEIERLSRALEEASRALREWEEHSGEDRGA